MSDKEKFRTIVKSPKQLLREHFAARRGTAAERDRRPPLVLIGTVNRYGFDPT
jgi:hypothetical protein